MQALRMVHHSIRRLDDLIEYIHNAVKPRAVPSYTRESEELGEKLKHPAPRPVIRCWLFEVTIVHAALPFTTITLLFSDT